MKVLVTGGAGYIGTHCLVELVNAGITPVVYDNLCNASLESLARVERISGQAVAFVQGDIRDPDALTALFKAHRFDAVLHLAGLKAVGESVAKPLEYYDNNVVGTLRLLEAMTAQGCVNLVFSSSATVYGDPQALPIDEEQPIGATTNPYGTSKYQIERMLADWACATPDARVIALRYFNPVGAHPSGLIGEDPKGIPNNLMPYVQQVAAGKLQRLSVYGDDYDTADGTGVRDYLHVVDLAQGHLAALRKLTTMAAGKTAVNLGTGIGLSVLQLVRAFEAACGASLNYQVVARRPGDIAACYADPAHAQEWLGWRAQLGLPQMCEDAWRWQSSNPSGYADT